MKDLKDRSNISSAPIEFDAPEHLHPTLNDIEDRMRKRYLERLASRVKKIRLLLLERDWEELRQECHQIAQSSEGFGVPTLKELAVQGEESIPPGKVSRASALPDARASIESLLTAIDVLLTNESILRASEMQGSDSSKP